MAKGDPSGIYSPSGIDGSSLQALAASVERELHRLAAVSQIALVRQLEFLHVEPDKPRDGLLVGADGSDWDPGSGQGAYLYFNSAWNPLASVGGAGIESGTSFPGTPATNDIFFRTDRGILYYYNGTRWLSVHQYAFSIERWGDQALNTARSTSLSTINQGALWYPGTYDLWLETFVGFLYVVATNDSSKYWTLTATNWGGSVTISTQGLAADAWHRLTASINDIASSTGTEFFVTCDLTKVSTPGNCYVGVPAVLARLIG